MPINPIFKSPVDISQSIRPQSNLLGSKKATGYGAALFDWLRKFTNVPQRTPATPTSFSDMGIGNLGNTNVGGFNIPQVSPNFLTGQSLQARPTLFGGQGVSAMPGVPQTQATVSPQTTAQTTTPTTTPTTAIPAANQNFNATLGGASMPTNQQGFLSNEQVSQLKSSGLSDEQISQLNQAAVLQSIFSQKTPEQKAQREGLQSSLQRLISLQEQMTAAGAPSPAIQQLDELIANQSKALEDLTPGKFLQTQKGLLDVGITQSQLEREVAARREPIAGALSDLLMSRSLLGQQLEQRQQALAGQIQGIGQQMELQQAINALAPQRGIPSQIQEKLLGNVITAPKKLSVADAKALGVSYGTTEDQAAALGVVPSGGLDAKAQERLRKVQGVENSVNMIENQIRGIMQSGLGTGRVSGSLRKIAAAAGFSPFVKTYNDLRESLIAPLARAISGEVGVLTDKDIARAEGLLPKVTETPQEIQLKLLNLRQAIDDARSATLLGGSDDQELEELFQQF